MIGHLRAGDADQFIVGHGFGFGKTVLLDQPPDFGKGVQRLRIDGIIWAARPQRIFVQLQPLLVDPAEDHGAQPPVADR